MMSRFVAVLMMVLILGPAAVFGHFAWMEAAGEVVILDKKTPNGGSGEVRIWIVRNGDGVWIEHGSKDSFWIERLNEDPTLTVTVGGAVTEYSGSADPDAHNLFHELAREKYGLADRWVRLLTGEGDACPGVPVRLEAIVGASE